MFMVFKVMVQNGYVNFVCAGGGGGMPDILGV